MDSIVRKLRFNKQVEALLIHKNLVAGEFNEFAALLDEYDYEDPYRGQILTGTIIEANDRELMIDVGLKRDAFVPRTDLERLDKDLLSALIPGKQVKAFVMQPANANGDLIVSINKGLELSDWEDAQQLSTDGGIVTVRVVGVNRGGVLVSFHRLTGFIPMSQLTSIARFSSNDELNDAKNDLISTELRVKIIEVDRLRNRLIFSERAARIQVQKVKLDTIAVGQDVRGRVVGLVDFGAFVDIGGLDGLIHISKLDHRFVEHPGEILTIGDEVHVRIESIDENSNRISLNRKILLADPWHNLNDVFKVGDVVEVSVTNVVDFGAFVTMPNGLQALVHTSNMKSLGSDNPRDVLTRGDMVKAKVISLEFDTRRIGVSIDEANPEYLAKIQAEMEAKHAEAEMQKANLAQATSDIAETSLDANPSLEEEVASNSTSA
ncbi:MAG: 30S ribosomal protein S1 [Phototrophicaceae bacterium]